MYHRFSFFFRLLLFCGLDALRWFEFVIMLLEGPHAPTVMRARLVCGASFLNWAAFSRKILAYYTWN